VIGCEDQLSADWIWRPRP